MEYLGTVSFDEEAEIFHGEVINIKDVVTFQSDSVDGLKREFKESIDDYLDFCRARNEKPDKPFSGKLTLRLDPDLHRRTIEKREQESEQLDHRESRADIINPPQTTAGKGDIRRRTCARRPAKNLLAQRRKAGKSVS